ncbi:uncharacterized protein isoform X2 [Choristoneura fumiferana]|uniref:uncharacterized protein isoform X2 n=1 Tax=Choristoneura fumiferana TaxID=7141 RepID=UPI003D1544D5
MMSDVEEPPTKVIKMDMEQASMNSTMEGQEDQEEWLSEGVLTDDDYLAGNISQDQKLTDDTMNSTQMEPEPQPAAPELKMQESIKMEQNIEDTLNNFEKSESEKNEKNDAFDQLLKKEKGSDLEQSEKHSDDDGHNTDDLLRMLGGDDNKKKKVLSSIREKNARRRATLSSDDDDDYIFEGTKMNRLKVAKNALMRKPAAKAEPEDMSDRDSDMSEEDVNTVKKMFTTKPQATSGARAPASRPYTGSTKTDKPKTPLKQYTNKSNSLLKPQEKKKEPEEIINEEEFLDDDDFDLDDDMGSMSSLDSDARDTQLIRRPERMDEEPPSDEESRDDDSLYDIMPSSDSEDMEDWFTLDIRAERAGDYLPWLGDKAHKLLTEEKHRVTAQLAALRQSVTALRSTERVQKDQIKVATEALHELDTMLAAA